MGGELVRSVDDKLKNPEEGLIIYIIREDTKMSELIHD